MDGLSLTIGGTMGAAIVSAVVKIWTAKQHAAETKIPQPCMTEQSAYQAAMKDNARDHEDIFTRLRNNEAQIAILLERSNTQGKTLDRIADQMAALYDRIILGRNKK